MLGNKHIISPNWLKDNLSDPNLVLLEVCQSSNKAGLDSTISGSIYGSIPVDLKNDFGDPESPFSNTFPSVSQFETICNRLGITNDSKIVIIDRLGIYSSPRIWFIFRAMGHRDVMVLDGGLPAWIDAGYKVVDALSPPTSADNYTARLDAKYLRNIDAITCNIATSDHILIDARSSDRFFGLAPEPRAGIRSGNIPKSINIPYESLLDGPRYKSLKKLRSVFEMHNLSDKSLIFSCGSGVTACIVMLAAELVISNQKSIYDGSWTEWATLNNKSDDPFEIDG